MRIKYLLPVVSILGIVFAGAHVWNTSNLRSEVVTPPPLEPNRSSFSHSIVAVGVVEPATGNISIGAPVPGIASEVLVEVGQDVVFGSPLFRLDDRQQRSRLRTRKAELVVSEARLRELEDYPRREQIPITKAKIALAVEELRNLEDQFRRLEGMTAMSAATERELKAADFAVHMAEAQLSVTQAEHELLLAGAPEATKQVARAEVALAAAMLEEAETELRRLTVVAPISGRVLEVNVRQGEYVNAPPEEPLVVLGDVRRLHVHAQIDEFQIQRYDRDAAAVAHSKDGSSQPIPLTLVRVEPLVVPKQTFTGDRVERHDTRVLKVVYEIKEIPERTVLPGQRLDLFIESAGAVSE